MRKLLAILVIIVTLYSHIEGTAAEGFYIDAQGGANFLYSSRLHHLHCSFDPGYIVTGCTGYSWKDGRLEAEITIEFLQKL